jgi:rhodanese-related sulfurtransferase
MIRKLEITTFDFPENAIIWDVRDAKAFNEGHIRGAVNQPINDLSADHLNQIDAGQPIYVLCGGGSKAPRAAELLHSFDEDRDIVVLMGGTRAAKAAGIALEQGQ